MRKALRGELCYPLAFPLLNGEARVSYVLSLFYPTRANLATNIPAGALPTPTRAQGSMDLIAGISILSVYLLFIESILETKKHTLAVCLFAMDIFSLVRKYHIKPQAR